MKLFGKAVLGIALSVLTATACGSSGDDDKKNQDGGSMSGGGALTAPTNLKVVTMDGKPHLTWTDGANEDHYMIERMDHSVSSTAWTVVMGADNLVPNSNVFHDGSAVAGKTYMYRVVAMKGQMRAVSNEVTWP
jgi:hypothetical protein